LLNQSPGFRPEGDRCQDDRRYDAGLIHRTARDELVRSKSEVIIANELYRLGVDYTYEKEPRFGAGSPRYPDFTIEDAASGLTVYWEHCGMLADPGYQARWEAKQKWYRANGVLPKRKAAGGTELWLSRKMIPRRASTPHELRRSSADYSGS